MTAMGKHSPTEAANRRARVSAWLVFTSMAVTTMSFQVYHSIKHGHMPWPLAVLYGVIPLFTSMLVIEVVSGWDGAPKWIRGAAYLIIGGAMFLSAAATGAVVLRAAPPHSSLLFGLLLDGAAILAARFLMTAVKKAAKTELASLQAELAEERSARLAAEAERDTARQEAGGTADRVAALEAALEEQRQGGTRAAQGGGTGERHSARPKTGTPARRTAPKDPLAQAAEAITKEQARVILDAEPGITGSELGRRLGVQEGYGRRLKRELAPADAGGGS